MEPKPKQRGTLRVINYLAQVSSSLLIDFTTWVLAGRTFLSSFSKGLSCPFVVALPWPINRFGFLSKGFFSPPVLFLGSSIYSESAVGPANSILCRKKTSSPFYPPAHLRINRLERVRAIGCRLKLFFFLNLPPSWFVQSRYNLDRFVDIIIHSSRLRADFFVGK